MNFILPFLFYGLNKRNLKKYNIRLFTDYQLTSKQPSYFLNNIK